MALKGIDAVLYRNTGNHGTPSWDEMDTVSDMMVNGSWQKGEGTTRASRVAMKTNTILDLNITGKIRTDYDNADYLALWNSWISGGTNTIDVMALTGPSNTNGSHGVRYVSEVGDFSEDQGLGTVLFKSFTLDPTITNTVPDSVVVASNAPVFTDFS